MLNVIMFSSIKLTAMCIIHLHSMFGIVTYCTCYLCIEQCLEKILFEYEPSLTEKWNELGPNQ